MADDNDESTASRIVLALLGDPTDDAAAPALQLTRDYVAPTRLEPGLDASSLHLDFSSAALCTVRTLRQTAASAALPNDATAARTVQPLARSFVRSDAAKQKILAAQAPRSGAKWFDLPSSVVDERAKADVQALALRQFADPSRNYKSERRGVAGSRFFQLGTVVQGNAEFFSSRITRKERKASLADELLDNAATRQLVKKRMAAIAVDSRPPDKRRRAPKEDKKKKKKRNK